MGWVDNYKQIWIGWIDPLNKFSPSDVTIEEKGHWTYPVVKGKKFMQWKKDY